MEESEKDTIKKFIRCHNCGSYVLEEEAVNDAFCSSMCALRYTRCLNCGKYFIKLDDNMLPVCSKECAVYYKDKLNALERSKRRGG
jgi:endogenous inhibitor of DNA gyrase (YacG/DUF329 family)